MHTWRIRLTLLMLSLSLASFGNAQGTRVESASDAEVPSAAAQTPDELLAELARQEFALYTLFNALNSSDAFDVTCSELGAPPQPARQVCEAAFMLEIREQVAEELALESATRSRLITRLRNLFVSPAKRAESRVRERARESIEEMQQEMESLARTDAQLAATLRTIARLQLAYLETVESSKSRDAYLMRQNDPSYTAFSNGGRVTEPRPILSAPPPGHTQPRIHFPVDRGLR